MSPLLSLLDVGGWGVQLADGGTCGVAERVSFADWLARLTLPCVVGRAGRP